MIFNYAERIFIPNPISGILKTEERILIDPSNDKLIEVNGNPVILLGNHPKYWIGKREPVYAVQGEPLMGWIIIQSISYQDVRTITPLESDREGYAATYLFMNHWVSMNDHDLWKKHGSTDPNRPSKALYKLNSRPLGRYYAWVIKFAVDMQSIRTKHKRLQAFDEYAFNTALYKEYPYEVDGEMLLSYYFSEWKIEVDTDDKSTPKRRRKSINLSNIPEE